VGSKTGIVSGSNPYSSNSNIEAAAVHASLIKPGQAGSIRVVYGSFQSGASSNLGTCRNGICSTTWDWGGCSLELSLDSSVMIANCETYSSGICSVCMPDFTLKSSLCIRSDILDSNCG
jgi:hypothetical protein